MMQRRFLLSVTMLSLATAASAADLPSRRAPAPYVPIAPVFTWTGFYVGGNVGGGDGSYFARNTGVTAGGIAAGTRPGTLKADKTGFTGGAQVGYNYQIGNFVVGAEADASYTDFGRTTAQTFNGSNVSARNNLDYLGTVRGRVGYAFDRVLVYGTGGLAYGDVYNRETFFPGAAGTQFSSGAVSNTTKTGYTYGGGVEYAIPTGSFLGFLNFFNTSAVTIKAEYLHYDLGRQTLNMTNVAGGNPYNSTIHTSGDVGRIGVNYKF